MANISIIGELSRLGGEKLKIVEVDGERFFCKDTETFGLADYNQRYGQKIHRVINNTVFYTKGELTLYAFTDEQKATLAAIQTPDTDENLLSVIKLCEGADNADAEIFLHCTHIETMRELQEMGSNLSAGLGFQGKGFGLIVAHFDLPYERRRVYLQVVHSYSEGYSVEHQQLTPEMFAFAHLPGVDKILFENDRS